MLLLVCLLVLVCILTPFLHQRETFITANEAIAVTDTLSEKQQELVDATKQYDAAVAEYDNLQKIIEKKKAEIVFYKQEPEFDVLPFTEMDKVDIQAVQQKVKVCDKENNAKIPEIKQMMEDTRQNQDDFNDYKMSYDSINYRVKSLTNEKKIMDQNIQKAEGEISSFNDKAGSFQQKLESCRQ